MTARDDRVIVVGVDKTEASRNAAVWAAALATAMGCRLRIVYVLPAALYAMTDIAVIRQGPAITQERKAASAVIDEATAAVQAHFPDLEVRADLAQGPTVRALTVSSVHARMLVIGTDVTRNVQDALTHSTAVGLAKHASCPVTVWRGRDGDVPDRRPVVVGVDGSASAQLAVAQAFSFAELFDAPLVAVRAWSAQQEAGGVSIPQLVDREAIAATELTELVDCIAPAAAQHPRVRVSTVVAEHGPARLLREHAEPAQLVVVGSRGRGRISGALLGSVGQYLLHHSACTIMICR
ncbi:universal stress protein [Rhodococcus koreensis]